MPEEAVLHMTQQQVEAYLEDLRVRHRTEETIQNYRTSLGQLYRDLPEGKPLGRETLGWWQGRLLASGYTPRTVNRALSVANSFLPSWATGNCRPPLSWSRPGTWPLRN